VLRFERAVEGARVLLVLNTTGANATRWERTVAADAQA